MSTWTALWLCAPVCLTGVVMHPVYVLGVPLVFTTKRSESLYAYRLNSGSLFSMEHPGRG